MLKRHLVIKSSEWGGKKKERDQCMFKNSQPGPLVKRCVRMRSEPGACDPTLPAQTEKAKDNELKGHF